MEETRIMQSKPKISKDDKRLSFAICAMIIGLYLTNISVGIARFLPISADTVGILCKAFIFLSLLLCVAAIFRRFNVLLFIVLDVMLLLIITNFLVFPDTSEFFTGTVSTFVMTILPGIICFALLEDYSLLLKRLTSVAYIVSIVNMAVVLFLGSSAFSSGYSMGYANSLILPANILMHTLFYNSTKKWHKLLLIVFICVNVVSILVYGSRGALIAILLYFAIIAFRILRKKVHPVLLIMMFAALALCLLFYKPILTALYDMLTSMGFNSRTLLLFITNASHDSGRGELWAQLLSEMAKNPFIAHGINSDLVSAGLYSHNFFLELCYSLGIIIGIGVSIPIIYYIVKSLMYDNTHEGNIRKIIMFSFFPMCLWSLSVWTSAYFWFWLVICIKTRKGMKPNYEKKQKTV